VNGFGVAESVARDESVLFMQFDFIVVAKSRGNPSLGVLRRGLAKTVFGDNENPAY
jgi:hypothetical protein